MAEKTKQAIESESIETFEKVWNHLNSKINHIVRVNKGHIEHVNIWIKLLECFNFITYKTNQTEKNTLVH